MPPSKFFIIVLSVPGAERSALLIRIEEKLETDDEEDIGESIGEPAIEEPSQGRRGGGKRGGGRRGGRRRDNL